MRFGLDGDHIRKTSFMLSFADVVVLRERERERERESFVMKNRMKPKYAYKGFSFLLHFLFFIFFYLLSQTIFLLILYDKKKLSIKKKKKPIFDYIIVK